MNSSRSGLDRLASYLEGRGLSTVVDPEGPGLAVTNPVSSGLRESVRRQNGSYLTSWGYEIGQAGHEDEAAERLAFLLGVPNTPAGRR